MCAKRVRDPRSDRYTNGSDITSPHMVWMLIITRCRVTSKSDNACEFPPSPCRLVAQVLAGPGPDQQAYLVDMGHYFSISTFWFGLVKVDS